MNNTTQLDNILLEQCEHTTLENEELFEYLNGLWKGKKPPYVNVKVLRNTNFNNDGTLSLEDVAELPVEEKQFRSRKLIAGDIILERSGGGPKQPVGRVVFFNLPQEDYSFSNFTTCIRVKNWEILKPEFLLYYLLGFYNQGHTNELQQRTTGIRNLNFGDYKKTLIPLPTIIEQSVIILVLKKVQQAITQQEQIIAMTKELKQSLMHRLFTYGLRGKELKETEIGLMPKSWKALKLNEVATLQRGKDLPRYEFKGGDIPVIGSNGCIGYHNQKIIDGPGVITGRSGSIGKVNYVAGPYWPHNTALYVKDFHGNHPLFIFYMMHLLDFSKYKTGVSVPTLNRNFIHNEIVPVPNVQEQIDIAEILSRIDKKTEQAESQHRALSDLFKSMLQLLMTGRIRIKDIDFGEINV